MSTLTAVLKELSEVENSVYFERNRTPIVAVALVTIFNEPFQLLFKTGQHSVLVLDGATFGPDNIPGAEVDPVVENHFGRFMIDVFNADALFNYLSGEHRDSRGLVLLEYAEVMEQPKVYEGDIRNSFGYTNCFLDHKTGILHRAKLTFGMVSNMGSSGKKLPRPKNGNVAIWSDTTKEVHWVTHDTDNQVISLGVLFKAKDYNEILLWKSNYNTDGWVVGRSYVSFSDSSAVEEPAQKENTPLTLSDIYNAPTANLDPNTIQMLSDAANKHVLPLHTINTALDRLLVANPDTLDPGHLMKLQMLHTRQFGNLIAENERKLVKEKVREIHSDIINYKRSLKSLTYANAIDGLLTNVIKPLEE